MLLKSYHHLHWLSKIKSSFVYKNEEHSNFDIFEMIANINKPTKELVNWELLIFWKYHVDTNQMPFGVVEKTWNYVSNTWFFS
jgi:hypothetical protein